MRPTDPLDTVAPESGSRSRRIMAATLAFMLTGAIAFTAVISTAPVSIPLGEPGEVQIRSAMKAISSCAPFAADSEDQCLTSAMTAAALREGPGAVFIAVQRLALRYPDITVSCHGSGHTVGQEIFKAVGSIDSTLAAADATCGGSYLHGLFDSFGDTDPGVDEYIAAAKGCNALPGNRIELCFDGLAHTMWRTQRSPEVVTLVCGIADTAMGRTGCLAGVLMQKYAPLLGEPTDNITDVLDTLAPFCAQLPAWEPLTVDPQDIIVPCLRGAVYPFRVRFLDGPLSAHLRSADTDDPTPVAGPMREYLAACDSLAVDTSEPVAQAVANCREKIGWIVYSNRPSTGWDLATNTCIRFLPGDEAGRCLRHLEDLSRTIGDA